MWPSWSAVVSPARQLPNDSGHARWARVAHRLRARVNPGPALQEYRLGPTQGFPVTAGSCRHYRVAWAGQAGRLVMRQDTRRREGCSSTTRQRFGDRTPTGGPFPMAGCSSLVPQYTFAEPPGRRKLPDWWAPIAPCFAFLGGVRRSLVTG